MSYSERDRRQPACRYHRKDVKGRVFTYNNEVNDLVDITII